MNQPTSDPKQPLPVAKAEPAPADAKTPASKSWFAKNMMWLIPAAIAVPVLGFLGLCCACGGFGMIFGSKDKPAGGGLFAAKPANDEVPPEQTEFVKQVESFTATYKSASNELKKSAARAERRDAIQKLFPSGGRVKNWVGTLTAMGTNGDGNAHLEVRLQGSKIISVKTWNNSLSDVRDHTLIQNGSDLFRKASSLSNGKKVVFSGEFMGSNLDHIKEASVTERGSMTEPAFIIRFEEITAK